MPVWIGKEKEGQNINEKRMFVKGEDSYSKVMKNLDKVSAVYFGHAPVDWELIYKIYRQTKVYVELEYDELLGVPDTLVGYINIVLRLPNYIRHVKIIDDDVIKVADFNSGRIVSNLWEGKLRYKDDKLL